jgi:deoxycytidylate deaminase
MSQVCVTVSPSMPVTHQQFKNPIEDFDYCDSELLIAFVCAVGTDYHPISAAAQEIVARYGYQSNVIKVSDLISALTEHDLIDSPETARISSRMDAGNAGCRESGRKDLWALAACAKVNEPRSRNENGYQRPRRRTVHLLFSLKRPEEVQTLRKVYGLGFYLVGVFATEKERLDYLIEQNAPKEDAIALIKRDAEEASEYGQQTRDSFQLSDVFVQLRNAKYKEELERFFDLLFANPYVTPSQQEHAMFLAYAASLRSGQLGRQVGAAITTRTGDVLAVGCNDVPKPGGGLYWPGPEDRRDNILGYDTNDAQRDKLAGLLIEQLPLGTDEKRALRTKFKTILDITEYGRAVHAEMDALLTCARSGVSPRGALLYTTAFPCHNCTRHIIAAGIQRVYYIEPYAKSRAEELHEDAILVEEKSRDTGRNPNRVPFTHFVGIGPRRYFDLFSLSLGSGHELQRKENGKVINIVKENGWPRVSMSPFSYIIREALAIRQLNLLPKQIAMFTENVDASSEE